MVYKNEQGHTMVSIPMEVWNSFWKEILPSKQDKNSNEEQII